MRARRTLYGLSLVAGLLTLAPHLRAQSAAPIPISGTVTTSGNQPVARAEVRILDANSGEVLADRIFTDAAGEFSADPDIVVDGEDEAAAVPTEFSVLPIYPNPFAATQALTLRYTLPLNQGTEPQLEVFDVLGRRVSGTLAAGLYFVRLRLDDGQVAPVRIDALPDLGKGIAPPLKPNIAEGCVRHHQSHARQLIIKGIEHNQRRALIIWGIAA